MQKSSPEIAQEVQAIASILRAVSIDATASYAALSSAAGRDVQTEARLSLIRARKAIEKETGARFATVFGAGVKRLAIEDIPSIGMEARRRIRRTARRAYARLEGMKLNDVPDAVAKKISTERAILGAVSLAASEKAKDTVAARIERADTAVPPLSALRAIIG